MRYLDFVAEELPDVCRRWFRGMSAKRELNFVSGCSMGGYGALRCALTHPENYAGCGVFSGALDIYRKGRKINMDLWRSLFDYNMVSADELEGTEHDLFHLATLRKEEGASLPALYFRCGTEDGLIENNRLYHDHLNHLGIDHQYEEAPGAHQWTFFGPSLEKALHYFQSL
jgi:S-formylglutathione hydrolase FrmB